MRQLLPEPGDVAGTTGLWDAYGRGPGLRANMVASLDGLAVADGRSERLSGPADRLVFRVLRALADVVLVGAGTARAEGYGPVRLPAELRALRSAAGLPPLPRLALVTATLRLDASSGLFAAPGPPPLVLVPPDADPAAVRALGGAEVIAAGPVPAGPEPGTVDLAAGLAALRGRGLAHVLCEGGPRLLRDLAAADLLDELCLTVSPLLLGGAGSGILAGDALPGPWRPTLRRVLEAEGMLFLTYGRG